MGMRRQKERTKPWRMMARYEGLKQSKGSGRAIIATARTLAMIIWQMLSDDDEFDEKLMVDEQLAKKGEAMRNTGELVLNAIDEKRDRPVIKNVREKKRNKTGVTSKKRKKVV
jgi:hypothetical protein